MEDFEKNTFILDIYTCIAMDLKPFFLNVTFSADDDRQMIKMLWEQCVPKSFYDFIKQPENFEYLVSQNVSFKTLNSIIKKFVASGQHMQALKNCFAAYYSTYQYVYSMLFPKYHTQNNKFGMKNKTKFMLRYEKWRSVQLGKTPFNFKVEDQTKRHAFEQKPINIDNSEDSKKTIPDTKKVFPTPPPQPSLTLMLQRWLVWLNLIKSILFER